MNELRLLFVRTGELLTYRITTSWDGDSDSPEPFVPFLSSDDEEDLRWYLEDYIDLPIGGALVRAARIERSLPKWGQKLFGAVFGSGHHRELFATLIDGSAPILTVATRDLDVLRLPWEMMADGCGPLTRRRVTIRRQLETAWQPKAYEAGTLPLRILLVVSRPDDIGFLDPRNTSRAILDALTPLGNGVVADFCRPATVNRLEGMLTAAERAGRPYHIVHFDGHGTFTPMSQIGALCFEDEEYAGGMVMTDMVRADRLGALLAAHRIPLAILEACRSGQVGNVAAFRGVAPALLEAGIGSVISMSHAVHVEATRIFLERFYEDLAAGESIGKAMESGRAALIAKPDRWLRYGSKGPTVALQDWFVPNLYQRGEDLVLVPGGAASARRLTNALTMRRAPATGDEPGAFPGEPMYGFFGRARELHHIERLLLKHRAVVLHAMGGMGKTSLSREAAFWWTMPTGLFPDGACFVSFEQPGGAQRAVQVLGAYFEGTDFEKRPAEDQERRARELFRAKRVLMVWDSFETVLPAFQEGETIVPYPAEERAQIYKLFKEWTAEDENGLGRLLVTCRSEETGLGSVCKVALEGLAMADALSLLYRVMQTAAVTAAYDRGALVGLLDAVERHPLSIELVGPHLRTMTPEGIVDDFQGLLGKFAGEAGEARNRSLSASIEFSLKRLSEGAREAVRWLGLFRGGVFEEVLLDVSHMDPMAWAEVRIELEATALVRAEPEIEINGRPYLRFHPTLAVASGNELFETGIKYRYVEVYLTVGKGIAKALRGSSPRRGMEVMAREEANFARAVGWALEQGAYQPASDMGDTLLDYLERTGRLRERDRYAAWLAIEVRRGGFSKAVADREMDEAWALVSQGEPRKGIEKLEALVARLRLTTEFDAAFALANASTMLGRVYNAVGWAQKAIPVLQDAVRQWETLAEQAQTTGGNPGAKQGNLPVALGDLANALVDAGALNEALAAAERGVAIDRERGDHRGIAAGLGRSAQILTMQGRHSDADARYEEAVEVAQRAGDREVEGALLQNQGILAAERKQYERAAQLYQRALRFFQDMHDEGGVTRTCNLLGVLEQEAGRLAEARAWYQRSWEMAKRRGNQRSLGVSAQNLGVVCQLEGEAARKQGNETGAQQCFAEAARFIGESLAIKVENQDEPGMAASHGQLARIYLLLGALDKADEHAHRALVIRERLGLQDAWKDYDTLANVARARNEITDASDWEQKRDALVAELRRRAGVPTLPQQTLQALTQLALVCGQAGLERTLLGADVEAALATISTWPAPIDSLVPFLRAIASGDLPSLPPSLPRELADALTQVLHAVQQASASGGAFARS
jgi:tetratricopeptide (TPR) repeat protein